MNLYQAEQILKHNRTIFTELFDKRQRQKRRRYIAREIGKGVLMGLAISAAALAVAWPLAMVACHWSSSCSV
jgi:hypothetical protein